MITRSSTGYGSLYRSSNTGRAWTSIDDAEKDDSGDWIRVYDPRLAKTAANPYHPNTSAYRWERKRDDDFE